MKNNKAETFRQLVEQEMQKPEKLRSYRKIARWTKQWEKCAGVEKSLDAAAARGMAKLMSQKLTEPDAETETYTVEVQRHPQWTQIAAAAACLLVVGGTTVGVMRMKPNSIETMENVETETETTSTPETTQGVTETTMVTSVANAVKLQTTAVTETTGIQTTVGVTETAAQSLTVTAEPSVPETITESQLMELPEETVATVLAEPEDLRTPEEWEHKGTEEARLEGFLVERFEMEKPSGTVALDQVTAVMEETAPDCIEIPYTFSELPEEYKQLDSQGDSTQRLLHYWGKNAADKATDAAIILTQCTEQAFWIDQPPSAIAEYQKVQIGENTGYLWDAGGIRTLLWKQDGYVFYLETKNQALEDINLLEAARTLHAYE